MRRYRQDDTVQVIRGKDRGKRGQIRQVFPDTERLIVQGVNIVKKHMKGQALGTQAGIIEMEAPIHWSNVAIICPDCDRSSRVGFRKRSDGIKMRYCKHCSKDLD